MSTCGYAYSVESPAAASLRRHGLINSEYATESQVALRADSLSQYLAANGREEEACAMTTLSFQTSPGFADGPRRGICVEPGSPDGRPAYYPEHGMSEYSNQQPDQQQVHRIPVARGRSSSPSKQESGLERQSNAELHRVLAEREIPHSDCRTREELLDRLNSHDSLGRRGSCKNQNGRSRSPDKKMPESRVRPSHASMPMNRRNNPSKRPTPSPPRSRSPQPSPAQPLRHSFHDPNAEVEIYCKPRPAPEAPPREPESVSPTPSRADEHLMMQQQRQQQQLQRQQSESEVMSPSRAEEHRRQQQLRQQQQQQRQMRESDPASPCRTSELLRQEQPPPLPWDVAKGGPSDDAAPANCTQQHQERAEWEQCCGSSDAAEELLFSAAKDGDIEELQSLVGVGGGVRLLPTRHPVSGGSALHEACEAGQDRAVSVLIKAAQHEVKAEPGDPLKTLTEWMHARDSAGNTALHVAAAAGHTLVVRTLMQAGADQDVLDHAGRTASQVAATEALQLAMSTTRSAPPQQDSLRLRTGVFAGGTYLPSVPSRGHPGRRRVALVMGNDNYSGGVSKLSNCVNDAKDMAVVLQQLNFMVMVVSDQTRAQMLACIRAFRQGIRDSDIVLVYFSGHGVEHEGVPYLLPLGANAVHPSDYELEAVSLNWILKTLNTVDGSSTNLLFLDSCRINTTDDTFKGEGGAVGFSMKGFRAPSGAEYCIALSSDPGTAAHSAPNFRNSVFTEHLLKCLANQSVSSLDVELMLRHVREGVMGATEQKQRPWTQSCLGVDGFRFLEPK
eukprot:TRINITY_DN374_c0_g1_i1.p1 TRINITY_DN374_c0_g1~~TRINITY_DN374_c0_g1_i1.p1  ORF type:complete len:787 (-),score=147.11 TRINITY_DN374_c0_g1_i1:187-2547(-)